jgi:hypothetical protein
MKLTNEDTRYVWSLKGIDENDVVEFTGTAIEAGEMCIRERRNAIGYRYIGEEKP